MKRRFSIICGGIMLLFAACGGEYHFKQDSYTRKVVVHSIINPDSVINVSVYWNKPWNDNTNFELIDGAEVEVREDGNVIFSAQTVDGVAESNVYPSAGKSYTLKVEVPDYPALTATTSIPGPADLGYSHKRENYDGSTWKRGYIALDVDRIDLPDDIRAVWLSVRVKYDNGSFYTFYSDLYSNNPFLDQVNVAVDPMDVLLRESNVVYERGFIRIQRSALHLAVPFTFSFYTRFHMERTTINGEYFENTYAENAHLYITAPSDEYDRYRRSAYKQTAYNPSPLINDPVSVYSNIRNGVGIFAGYNLTEIIVPIDNPTKP